MVYFSTIEFWKIDMRQTYIKYLEKKFEIRAEMSTKKSMSDFPFNFILTKNKIQNIFNTLNDKLKGNIQKPFH